MDNLIKVKAVKDESCHWYIIPNELGNKLTELHNLAIDDNYDAQDEFELLFSKYRTGGDLNNKQLYAEI